MPYFLSPYRFGFVCCLVNMITYGLTPTAAKYFMHGYDPLLFTGLATLVGGIPLSAALLVSGKFSQVYAGPQLKPFLAIGILTAFASGLFFVGTSLTSAMNTGLLEQIEPVYALALSAFLLRERITSVHLLATLLMVGGAVVVVFQGYGDINPGDAMILTGPLFFQLAHLVAKRALESLDHPLILPTARLLISGALITGAGVLLNPESIFAFSSWSAIMAVVLFALIFRALDMVLWYTALKYIPLSMASSLLPLGAAISFVASMLILGEVATTQHVLGLLLILSGLIMLVRMKEA